MKASTVSRWYLLAGVPVTIVYLLVPEQIAKLVIWPVIGWSSVIAIVIGVHIHRPTARLPWYLLAAGVATLIIGDDLYSFRNQVQHADGLFPSYIDVIYLAMYPLLIGALALLVHHRSAGRDRAGLIDTAVITVGLGLVSWVVLIVPYVRAGDIGMVERMTSIAYPVGDVALLAMAARLAMGSGRRSVAFWLLAGSLVPLLVSDALYGYLNLAGMWHEHSLTDIGWAAFYFGWGSAALHPTMSELTQPTNARRRITTGRLVLVGSAVLVAPAVLFVQQAIGEVSDAAAIAIASAALFALVLVRIAGLTRDASDERNEERFRALVENSLDAIVVLDVEGRIVFHTPSTPRVLGRTVDDLSEMPLAELLDQADRQRLRVVLASNAATVSDEWRVLHEDGEWRDVEVVAADMRGSAHIDGVVLTMRDITERKRLDAELRRQALHDLLTGLPNRTLFIDRVEQALRRAEREGGGVGVLLFDLDDFKTVNDGVGHAAGDELLKAVAARLKGALASDSIARLGGDEFALLLENGDVPDGIELAALRVQAAMEAPFLVQEAAVSVRASIGIASGAPATHRAQDLLRDADLAMYVAKRNGKDRYEHYLPAMHEEASQRLEVASELRHALDHDELVLFYQPILDIFSNRVVGAEALVRWQHPTRGLIAPDQFIPIAESTGLVVPLGRWVLNEACHQAAAWIAEGRIDDSFSVSVNLSGRHIQDVEVVHDVERALSDSGLAPGGLVVEVTETALMGDLQPAIAALSDLRDMGVRIAVDDFGTGYSSFSYLSTLPVDRIKIDKSFVDHIAKTADGYAMVRAVVDLTHTLGLQAIAEGVEHEEQASALRDIGCRFSQGYLFARPMPASDLATFIDPRFVAPNSSVSSEISRFRRVGDRASA